jgi:3-hydroxyisobutyrate dehydrogenase-like beta-hydroxyacid dehydrogenase
MTGFAYLPAYRSARAPARVALIGFDATAQSIALALAAKGTSVAVYDRAFEDPYSAISRALRRLPVVQYASVEGVVADAELIVASVAGDLLFDTARRIARLAEPNAWFCDCTAADDAMARRAVSVISGAALRYAKASLSPGGIALARHVPDLTAILNAAGLAAAADTTAQPGAQIIPFPGRRRSASPGDWDPWREMIA